MCRRYYRRSRAADSTRRGSHRFKESHFHMNEMTKGSLVPLIFLVIEKYLAMEKYIQMTENLNL